MPYSGLFRSTKNDVLSTRLFDKGKPAPRTTTLGLICNNLIKQKMNQHTQANGVQIPIGQMTDVHLKNTIGVLIRTAELCAKVVVCAHKPETVNEIIHGVSRKQQINSAKSKLKELYNRLPPYIMEASIRGMDFGKELREAFDREEKPLKIDLPIDFRIEDLLIENE